MTLISAKVVFADDIAVTIEAPQDVLAETRAFTSKMQEKRLQTFMLTAPAKVPGHAALAQVIMVGKTSVPKLDPIDLLAVRVTYKDQGGWTKLSIYSALLACFHKDQSPNPCYR